MSNVATYMGPIFSLVMCLGMTALSAFFFFGTKAPLLATIAPLGIAVIMGLMVASDWKTFWGPLLSGKPVS